MKSELFQALEAIEKEKNIPMDFLVENISNAIATACKSTYKNENVKVNVNEDAGEFEVYLLKEVCDEVYDPNIEILIDDARKINPDCELGDFVDVQLHTKEFARIAAHSARNIIRQGIRDGEKRLLVKEFENKKKDIITGVVDRVDPNNGTITFKKDKGEAKLPKSEQIPGDDYKAGDTIKVYVVDVKTDDRGPRAVISRTHPDFVKRLFEAEVAEISNGEVEIKAVSREAGSRTKMAVMSYDESIDPIGACIGENGMRVRAVVDEIRGEKIDIVKYSDDPQEFVKAALSPANALKVEICDSESKSCKVTVPDGQLSLAIGNKGQNARLAAKLTGWKIDIKPESGFYGEDEDEEAEAVEEAIEEANEIATESAEEIKKIEDETIEEIEEARDEAIEAVAQISADAEEFLEKQIEEENRELTEEMVSDDSVINTPAEQEEEKTGDE